MSLLRASHLAVPFLSLFSFVVACGGAIESSSEREINEPPRSGGSSGSSGTSGTTGVCSDGPRCDPGDARLDGKRTCTFSENCYERSSCGVSIRCARLESQCAAYPACAGGYVEVPASACTTKDCVAETVCGTTIYCVPDEAQCDGYPQCEPGHLQVKSPSGCYQDDAVCYSRSSCGVTIWCTGSSASDAGFPDLPPPPKPPKAPPVP